MTVVCVVGGKKKPLKAPKKQAKDMDDVSIIILHTANVVGLLFSTISFSIIRSAQQPHKHSVVHLKKNKNKNPNVS